jgi:hypothetical protein
MTASLGVESRIAVSRFVQWARRLLEEDLSRQAEGRFGIHIRRGEIEDESQLRLNVSELAVRHDLIEIFQFLMAEERGGDAAAARLIREAAFTHLNRLIAIRVAEENGLLPESVRQGPMSSGFRDLLEVAPLLAREESGGYWRYLQLCGDELAADLPNLFDPRNPLLELAPSSAALGELVSRITASDLQDVWGSPDLLGWTYQFFNTSDERKSMRESSSAPRNSRELAVRNQFFTPNFVVDYLVQNTLGRRLVEVLPGSNIVDSLPLLVDSVVPSSPAGSLEEIRVLDPACGSGHFLLAAYDLLELAWIIRGVSPADSAPQIISALWGVDIDARCAQVAGAALVFRARRHRRVGGLPTPNIITARALPEAGESWNMVAERLPTSLRDVLTSMRDALSNAALLGSLLKIDEIMDRAVRSRVLAPESMDDLFTASGIAAEMFKTAEDEVMDALQGLADETTSTPAERLFVASVQDGVRFAKAMRQRYDVVLMNPPFGDPISSTAAYLKKNYPSTWTELYACFVLRGVELAKNNGYLGSLTSSRFFITRRMAQFRGDVIDQHRPLIVIDLGSGVLDGATVDTALMVMPIVRQSGRTLYADFTVSDASSRAVSLSGSGEQFLRSVDMDNFRAIDGTPFAFHLPDSAIALWRSADRFEPDIGIVRSGGKTFDDFRFLRARWEVNVADNANGWTPFNKGGDYQPYFCPSHLVVNWRDEGRQLREFGSEQNYLPQIMQSSTLWFKAGLTYPRVSSIGLGVRSMPEGEIFSTESNCIFLRDDVDPIIVLGLLNSTMVAELSAVFDRGRKTDTRAIKSLPLSATQIEKLADLKPFVNELIEVFKAKEIQDETSPFFCRPWLDSPTPDAYVSGHRELIRRAQVAQQGLDSNVEDAFHLSGRLDASIEPRSQLVAKAWRDYSVDRAGFYRDLLSYAVGVSFGRWDGRAARADSSLLMPSDVFERVPLSPPGALDRDDSSYLLEVPSNGLLIDEVGHEWDLETRLAKSMSVFCDDAETMLNDALSSFKRHSLRDFMRRDFFKLHLTRYTKSRRKAPIYWPLGVPSGHWGLWVYAPSMSRETLYAIASEAARREAAARSEVTRLEQERAAGAEARGAKALDNALDRERDLSEELVYFHREAMRVAEIGWQPDLDDGIVLCAAPLADLFPQWRELGQYRDQLRKGRYEWAAVSRWAETL